MYKGMLIENYVAINLNRNHYDLFYWTSDATAEIDFIINIDNNIIPIEVKASDNTKSKSLAIYRDKYHPQIIYRISMKNFGENGGILSIPLYAIHLL